MEIKIILLLSCTVLTVLAGIFVLLPLFRKSDNSPDIEFLAETELDRLVERKTAIYRNLKDLAFEYEMGRLSEEDFRQLEAGYKTDAAVILQKLEQMGASEHLDESIEKDIASKKNGVSADASKSSQNRTKCSSCGADVIPGKNFCADCGHRLQ
jgi:rRNA maturation endonuclease Nob1